MAINYFCKMTDQQMHYYEKHGDWNKLHLGYQVCSEILFAY